MNRRSLRRLAATAGLATLLAGASAATSAPAFADGCGAVRDVYISGGESHYTITCSGGYVYVDGRVRDTRADGRCAQVKAQINGSWHYSQTACPSGTTRYFSWSGPGSSANVYTYLV